MTINHEISVTGCCHTGTHMSQWETSAVSVRKAVTDYDIYARGIWHIQVSLPDEAQEASSCRWPFLFSSSLTSLPVTPTVHCDEILPSRAVLPGDRQGVDVDGKSLDKSLRLYSVKGLWNTSAPNLPT